MTRSAMRSRSASQPARSAYGAYCTMAEITCPPGGRERRIARGRHGDLERGRGRVFAVLAVIEGTLDVVERRRDQQAAAERRRVLAGEPRRRVERQVQLGGEAVGAQVADPAHEAGVEMFRTEQLQQRRLRVGAGDHRARRDALTGVEQHAAGGVVRRPARDSPGRPCGSSRPPLQRLAPMRRTPHPCRRAVATVRAGRRRLCAASRYSNVSTVPGERGPKFVPSTASRPSAPCSSGDSNCSCSRS